MLTTTNLKGVLVNQCSNKMQKTHYAAFTVQRNFKLISADMFKVGLSPSKKFFIICFNDSPSKMIKNAFYFILKVLFFLKIFKFLS